MSEEIKREYDFDGKPIFMPPVPLPEKSPLRLLAIDTLMNGEEILPKNFTLVFKPNWVKSEVRTMKGIYDRVLPVIGISGKVIFLDSKYQDTPVEQFLRKQRRK